MNKLIKYLFAQLCFVLTAILYLAVLFWVSRDIIGVGTMAIVLIPGLLLFILFSIFLDKNKFN